MTLDLISPLSVEACVQTLRLKTSEGWSGSVIGSVKETSFRLRKRIGYRNSFQTSLHGTLVAENGQTRLHCKLGLHPFVRVFMMVWLGIVSIVCAAMAIRTINLLSSAHRPLPANWWQAMLVPCGMLAGGVALLGFGKRLAGDEPDFLIDFVRRTLDARDA